MAREREGATVVILSEGDNAFDSGGFLENGYGLLGSGDDCEGPSGGGGEGEPGEGLAGEGREEMWLVRV